MSVIVLIVDDDNAVRFFHRIIVTQSGLCEAPLCFTNGADAFEYLEQNFIETNSYLIFLDINMPVMNGWDLLNSIKKNNYDKNVHVVMTTSSADDEDHKRANQYKMVMDYVEKPITSEQCKAIMTSSEIAACF